MLAHFLRNKYEFYLGIPPLALRREERRVAANPRGERRGVHAALLCITGRQTRAATTGWALYQRIGAARISINGGILHRVVSG